MTKKTKKTPEIPTAEQSSEKKKPAVKKSAEKKPVAKKVAEKKPAIEKKPVADKKPVTKKKGAVKKAVAKTPRESKPKKLHIKYLGGLLLRKMARSGAQELGSNAEEVNKLNVFPVPDGDTGDNMRMTIESGVAAIENVDSDNLADVMNALSHGMLMGARGNSGVILSQFFAGTAKGLSSHKADPATLGKALEMGVKQAYSSVMTPTEGTILTVAREAVEYAVRRITPKSTIHSFFADLVREMHNSLERTPEALSALKEAGVVDSGGAGLFYIMDGFYRVLNGEEVPEVAPSEKAPAPKAPTTEFSFNENSEMTYGYCTELLLQLQKSKTDIERFDMDALKEFLSSVGDSIVAFLTGSIVKVHVHTFTPERVLGHLREYGEFLTVKIENMSVQHTELEKEEPTESTVSVEATPETPTPNATLVVTQEASEKKHFGAVAVSLGEGIEKLFLELGADVVIHGGQTNNPSTSDFLEAFARINAEHIFVFPNNGNIIMAAGQAADLYEGAKVHVIPTKNIGTGYVALSSLDFSTEDSEEAMKVMTEATERVTSGYVSPSIRDADMNGITIKNGDTIGIVEKEIVVADKERMDATYALVSHLLSMEDKFMLTVFVGVDATNEEREQLQKYVEENHSDIELYFVDGGQEIYPFIFVAE